MKRFIQCATVGISLLLLWQVIILFFNLPFYILPSPWDVFLSLLTQSHLLIREAYSTCLETLLGFFLGILFGCLAGLTIAFVRPLRWWFFPVLIISQAIPTFAIAPLIVLWLGYGLLSKIAVTVLMIFFPVTSAFYDGLRQTPEGWLDLAKTMNATPWRRFCTIQLPAALPALASGIRIAAVIAPVGAVIGEWVGASQGLGYLMLNANARLQIDLMFAALLFIITLALLLYFSVDGFLKRWEY